MRGLYFFFYYDGSNRTRGTAPVNGVEPKILLIGGHVCHQFEPSPPLSSTEIPPYKSGYRTVSPLERAYILGRLIAFEIDVDLVSHYPKHVSLHSGVPARAAIALQDLWRETVVALNRVIQAHQLWIHVYVLMANHLHLLLTDPGNNLEIAIRNFRADLIQRLNPSAEPPDTENYWWSEIISFPHYKAVYKYILRNPVDAGICARVEDYPYSSIYYESRNLASPIIVVPSRYDFKLLSYFNMRQSLRILNGRGGKT